MKAKTLMGMIACASACVSLSAFGNTTNDWFAVTVDNDITTQNCATNGAAVQVSDGKIVLDNEKESALTFAPVATNMSTGVSVIRATAELTPSDANFDTPQEGAKVGFAVGVAGNATNYYGFASGEWFKLDGVNPPDSGNTDFQLILDYRSETAQFFVKNSGSYHILSTNGTTTAFAFDKGIASDISRIDAYGSGSITSLAGKFELAVAAYNGTKYGSIDEAVTVAGDSAASVVTYDESGAAESSTAENGMPTWVCKALDIATNDGGAKPVVVPSGADKSTSAITLKLNYDPTRDGAAKAAGVLKFKVGAGAEQNSDNIQIPLESGKYQIKVVY